MECAETVESRVAKSIHNKVPSRFMRKIVCRLRLNEVLMKDAAQKTPRKSAVFSHIYQFFRCKKLENEIFQRHDLRARAVRVGAEH